MVNSVVFDGNLVTDPEIRTVGSTSLAKLRLASTRKFNHNGELKESTTFIDVDIWGKSAETAGKILHKGERVLVEGRLEQDTWEQDGVKRSKIFIRANSFDKLTRKVENEQSESAQEPVVAVADGEDIPF